MLAAFLAPLLLSALPFDAVEIDGLKSTPPDNWKERRPGNPMQYKVFVLPKAEGDKEETVVTIFTFPKGQGGDWEANLKRWKGQIDPGPDKKIDEVAKVEKYKVGNQEVALFDATGTYLFKPIPINPDVVRKENYRLMNVYFERPSALYTIRCVGPVKSVTAQEKGFKDWIKNFK